MSHKECRICGEILDDRALIVYENMPKAAQNMPDVESVKWDSGINLIVKQCKYCGTVQLSNEPVEYYREVIRASGLSKPMQDFRKEQYKNFIAKYHLHGKKIVEVACGKGEYLGIMAKLPVTAYGMEFSMEAVRCCEEKGLNVFQGYFETGEENLAQEPFDGFYILNYLEHVPEPAKLLKGIHKNLMDEAVGIIEVPNFNMILKESMFSEFIVDHLVYYTEDTLKLLLNITGFEVLEFSEIWDGYILSATVRKKKGLDLGNFQETAAQMVKDINQFIEKYPKDNIAVWGAGHQSLTVISMAALQGKIKYVIDSAPFKQGKFTQATHIPIVSPEQIERDEIKAILVIAAGYSDEIAEIIQKDYPRIQIAILRKTKVEIFV